MNSLKIDSPTLPTKRVNQDHPPALIPGPRPKSTLRPPSQSTASILRPRSSPQSGLRFAIPPSLLTHSLLQIYARHLSLTQVPQKLHLAADMVSHRLQGANERKWTIEYRNHGDKSSPDQKDGMRTITLIIWEKGVKEFAAEIMVHLRFPLGETVSIFWRFGPKYAAGVGGESDDWQTFHFQRYFALEVSGPDGKSEMGTREVVRIDLKEGRSIGLDSVVELVWRGVKTALGKGYEPSREELQGLMGRVEGELGVRKIQIGKVVVTRGFGKAENGLIGEEEKYFPAAFVEVYARDQELVGGEVKKAAAVIPVDVLDDGDLNLMGVIYEGEQPVIHFYGTRYPPPIRKNPQQKEDDEGGDDVK
jgi:hypothetical protein